MAETRNLSIRKRLERLEATRAKQAEEAERDAIIILSDKLADEYHLVTSQPGATARLFQQAPGPGKQLWDFGRFTTVVHLTSDEANA
jgi:hypothetical protein